MKNFNDENDKGSQSPTRTKWRQWMDSTQKKLSRGAANLVKIITSAHKDQWRRNSDHHNLKESNKNKK